MTARKGLRLFGDRGAEALCTELEQLLDRKVMHPVTANSLSREQRSAALRYLMFLKEKRTGVIKGRGCADGRKQRVYKTKEETRSPTVSTEAFFLTCLVDAHEQRDVATLDIPGAFMQAAIEELVHVRFDGDILDQLLEVDPELKGFLHFERGRRVLYTKLQKALYGTMQATLLFWQTLTSFLVNDLGFVQNDYNRCVVNKLINGKQCTIIWHVDDLKILHCDPSVVSSIVRALDSRFGKESPVTVTRGRVHEYLGITIKYKDDGSVSFDMPKYVDSIVSDILQDLQKGPDRTPAANHLFNVNDSAEPLNKELADQYHHLVAQMLYLAKRTRPDILTAVSFLSTRVKSPDVDDWKKLGRCMRYLRANKNIKLTLYANSLDRIEWWVDASFAVHPNMCSHTGATLSLGRGSPYSFSSKQKINTRSSTEAELVGMNDVMGLIVWTKRFLEGQGFRITSNVVHQDNQSAMLLERNRKMSSSKQTRHIHIRYFFITDAIRNKDLSVSFCATDNMTGDFFTKPLQGKKFIEFRNTIMNLGCDSIKVDPATPQECVATSENVASDDAESSNFLHHQHAVHDVLLEACDTIKVNR